MNRRLLLGFFEKTFLFVLLITLLGPATGFAQTSGSGYGDFIIFEDFGKAVANHPDHERYSSWQNNGRGEIFFKKTPLSDIDSDNLIFYIPSNLPTEYQGQNWGPQYRDNVKRGSYSIVTNSSGYRNEYFIEGEDHTENDGDLGYMLLVDAHSSTELYFDQPMNGLCAGTRFEFSAWIKDVNTYNNTKPRIRFDIINASNGQIIDYYESTDADVSPANTWQKVTMEFEMPSGVSEIKLQITNIVANHDGNDIAIDDIGFRPMGPSVDFVVSPQLPACVDGPVTFTAHVVNKNEAYPNNHFVLQRRENGSSGNWEDVGGYKISQEDNPVTFEVSAAAAQDNYLFRVVVAGDPSTLASGKCRAVSDSILLRINNQVPEISVTGGGSEICINEAALLSATVTGGVGDPVYTFVWEKSTDQLTWEAISGAADATLNTGALIETTYYRVTAWVGGASGCPGAGASSVFTVTVNPLPDAPVVATTTTYVDATGIVYNATALVDHTLVWFDENGDPLTPNEEPTVNTAVAGEYMAYVAQRNDDTGCISPIVPVKVLVKPVAITVEKEVNSASIEGPGSLTYTVSIKNTGEYDLTDVQVTDVLTQQGASDVAISDIGTPTESGGNAANNGNGILEISETWTYTFGYPVDQGQIDRGAALVNTVWASTREGAADDDDAITTITQTPSVTVNKTVDQESIAAPGTLNYTIVVSNTGNVSLTGLSATDAVTQDGASTALTLNAPTGDDTNPGILDVGEAWTYTVSYAVAQSHIDNGSDIVNTFTFDADELTDGVSDDATTTITQSPSVTVEKTVDPESIAAPGSLNYTIVVANTGNVSLTGVTATDAVAQGGTSATLTLGTPTGDDTNPGILDVGETWTYAVTYAVAQSHIDNGSDIVNTFTFDADELTDGVSDDATTTITQTPSVTVNKTVDPESIAAPGTLNYTIVVANTGNVSLTGVTATDAVAQGGTSTTLTLGTPTGDDTNPGILDVGEAWTYTVSYAATQSHIDNGGDIVNTFTFNADELTAAVSDDATTTITQSPSVTVNKTVDPESIAAPGTLNYTIVVSNTGNVSLTGITFTDALTQGTGASESLTATLADGDTDNDGELDIDETWTYAVTYAVAQSHIDNGGDIVNTFTFDADELGTPVSDDATTTITQNPLVTVDKVVDLTAITAPGTLNYTITVENTGNVSLTGITFTDALTQGTGASESLTATLADGDTDNDGELDVDETWTYAVTYAVAQSHIDNGGDIVNTFTFNADELTAAVSDDATTTITQSPSVTVNKTVDPESIAAPGTLDYTIVVANTGNVSLTGITATDAVAQGGTSATLTLGTPVGDDTNPGILDVGETWTYTVSYAATQSHIDNGGDIVNTFTFNADELTAAVSDDATTTITQSPSVTVNKTVDPESIAAPGTLNYTIVVSNTGNVSLTGIAVSDAVAQGGTSATLTLGTPVGDDINPGILDVGETWTYTVSYAATQSHIDNGGDIVNTFTFDADELGTPVSDDATTTITQTPSVTVNKTVDPESIAAPGTLDYTIVVSNTGNISLTGVTATDAVAQGGTSTTLTLGTPTGDDTNPGILDVGETWTYTVSYAATQSHIDNGGDIVNTFTFDADELTGGVSDDATTTITQSASVTVDKTVDQESITAPGTLNYTIVVSNTGNVSLTGIAASDEVAQDGASTALTLNAPTGDDTNPGILDVGEAWAYTVTYAVVQSHIDNGGDIVNVFTFDADELSAAVSDDATTTITQSPLVTVDKVVDLTAITAPGTLNYTITVANTGNVSLTGITFTDAVTQGAGASESLTATLADGDTDADGILDVDETWEYTVSYTVSQSHIDNGNDIVNTFTFDADELTDAVSDDATTTITQSPSVTVNKTVDQESITAPGTLNYTIVVSNTGNMSLTGLSATDAVAQNGASTALTLNAPVGDDTNPGILDVGETWTYTVTCAVAQSHIDNGGDIVNTFTFDADELGTPASDDATTTITQSPSVTVAKDVDLTTISAPATLNYTIVVSNTGNVSLTGLSATDAVAQDGTSTALTLNAPTGDDTNPGILDVGETWTYTASYAVAQSHVDNGGDIVNTFTFDADELTDGVSDDATTTITQSPSVTVNKTVDQESITAPATLNYTITVENTGNVSLTGLSATDAVAQDGTSTALTLNAPTGDDTNPGILDVGETWTYTVTYAVAQSHIDNGGDIVNVFTFGADELGTPVSDDATTRIERNLGVQVTKTADKSTVSTAGEVITYTITVTNTGNVTLANYTVTDVLFPEWSGSIETLAPAATRSFELTYTVTQTDIDKGGVVNVASVRGDNPGDPEDEDEVEVPSDKQPGIEVSKTADKSTVSTAGEVITYTITVTNTGNVTLANYTVTDVLFPEWSGRIETLAPAATRSFELTYTVTQADIDKGGVVNVASATGDNPGDPEDEDEVEVPSDKQPGIEVSKTADKSTVSTAGEVITYTITVTNTGNVTLANYTVTDVLFPEWSGSIETLAPAATRSFELTYTVTQTDIDKGGVVNVASVKGDNPGDPEDEDEVEVPSDKQPGIEVSKAADKSTVSTAGEVITYTITVTNTGNVTLENYTVTDVLFPEWNASIETLAPAATRSFELEYTVTQADIDKGGVLNVASATGENPGDPEDEDEVEVPVGKDGSISIAKLADRESFNNIGDVITYTITVTNTGNVTLSNAVVTDVLFPEWSASIETLAPKATQSFELKYTITAADVDEGSVRNVAKVVADDPDGGTPDDETEIEVPGVFGPVANDDGASTNQDSPVTINLVSNDEAGTTPIVAGTVRLVEPGTGEAITTVTIEGEGTYTVGTDGTVTFVPDAEYVGISTVTYTVKDENGLESNVATITITVEGVAAEIAPTANDDQANAPYGQSVEITVLANDQSGSSPIVPSTVRLIDASGNPATSVTIPDEGRYSVDAQGVVMFEPADGFTGTSTARYEVTDENGLVSNIALISVTVEARPFKIPNVFTPNGDGKNDVFEIVGIESFDRVEITVVNRWGNEVYRNNNYQNNWDGQGLNEGTYYYVIITHDSNRQERYAGWVLIKK